MQIGAGCFTGCSLLQNITVDAENHVYDSRQGCNCVVETQRNRVVVACVNSSIVPSIQILGSRAFCNSRISSISLPNSLQAIEDNAFANSVYLERITIPHSVRLIGNSAFANCKSLSEVVLSDAITAIPEKCFIGCSSLKQIHLPSGLVTIGKEAFKQCSALQQVWVGSALRTIDNNAFRDCATLSAIHYSGSESNWSSISKGLYNANLLSVAIDYT